jgi:hypothetical protein
MGIAEASRSAARLVAWDDPSPTTLQCRSGQLAVGLAAQHSQQRVQGRVVDQERTKKLIRIANQQRCPQALLGCPAGCPWRQKNNTQHLQPNHPDLGVVRLAALQHGPRPCVASRPAGLGSRSASRPSAQTTPGRISFGVGRIAEETLQAVAHARQVVLVEGKLGIQPCCASVMRGAIGSGWRSGGRFRLPARLVPAPRVVSRDAFSSAS